MTKRLAPILFCSLFLYGSLIFAQTPGEAEQTEPAQPPPPTKSAPAAPAATATEPQAATAPAAPAKAKKPENRRLKRVLAIFEIEHEGQPMGTIKAQLFVDKAPKTTDNFIGLAEGTKSFTEFDAKKGRSGELTTRPFYDGLTIHRIVPNYVVQGGCPLGTGRGSPGFTIPDEFASDLRHDTPGVLSMANTGVKNTGGSQFFITLVPLKHLDGKYSVFGHVIEGMDVVKKIGAVKRNPMNERPTEPVVMKKVTIVREYAN
jgi:peptidyl-prolyl cis-trans isomerase A (cyclophilin A)